MSILNLWHNKRIEAISKKKRNQLELYLYRNKYGTVPAESPLIESDSDFFEWKGIFNSYGFFDTSWQSGINKVSSSLDLEKDWPGIFKAKRLQELLKSNYKPRGGESRTIKVGPDGRDIVHGQKFYLDFNGMNTYRDIRNAIEDAEMLINIDPTGQDVAKYVDWLAKSYVHRDFYAEDAEDVKSIMALYHHLDKNNVLKEEDKNLTEKLRSPQLIDQYLAENYPKHYKRDRGATLDKRIEDLDISEGGEDGEFVYQDDQYDLIKSNSVEGLGKLGNGTRWCTREEYGTSFAEDYLEEGTMYTLFKDKLPYAQWHFGDDIQVMDVYDNPIEEEDEQFEEISNFLNNTAARDPQSAFNWITDQTAQTERELPKELYDAVGKHDYFTEKLVKEGERDKHPHLEPYIAKDPLLAIQYAKKSFSAPSPIIEEAIGKAEPDKIEDYLWKMNSLLFKEIFDETLPIDDRIGGYRGGERADHEILRMPNLEKLLDPQGDYMYELENALAKIEELKQYLANETHEQYMERFKKEEPDAYEQAMAEQQADEAYDLAAQEERSQQSLIPPDEFSRTL